MLSTTEQENNKRIAKNTIYLYIRMFLTMIVSLYTSRIVLRVLGDSDYGLYNVIGGILTMFSMFSGALTVGTQRFLTFALGEKTLKNCKVHSLWYWGFIWLLLWSYCYCLKL